jgi:Flp pilus assembly protein TadG
MEDEYNIVKSLVSMSLFEIFCSEIIEGVVAMKPRSQERGQALILIVFAAVAFFGFVALAIDGSRIFSDRRHAQNAADTAVLAAALAKIKTESDDAIAHTAYAAAVQAGENRAASNGFDSTNSIVQVTTCDDVNIAIACEGLPAGADASEYIQVYIKFTTQTTFARIIGRPQVESVVTAIARAVGEESLGTSSSAPALMATEDQGSSCFVMNGGANLTLNTWGSGIFVNCPTTDAAVLSGSANLNMEVPGQVVGCFQPNGGFNYSTINCGVPPQSFNASTFASVPTTLPAPTCSAPGVLSGNTYTPGNYANITVTSGTYVMNPGVYCVSGGIIVAGGTLSGPGGRVQIVLGDPGIILSGNGSNLDFTDLEIYSNNGNITIAGAGSSGGIVRAARLRYFSTGAGTVDLGGGAELTSGNAYFYFHRGNIRWNGNSILNLHGPPQGDPFGGLLFHKPWDNHEEVVLNGGSSINLTGTFMVPGSHVTINGNAAFELHSQIIGSTFTVAGSAQVDIFYDPSENYGPPNSPMIQLTK